MLSHKRAFSQISICSTLHPSDVTKALFEAKHAIKKSTVRKHLGSQLDQKYKNLIRKIENDYENKWNNQLSSIQSLTPSYVWTWYG